MCYLFIRDFLIENYFIFTGFAQQCNLKKKKRSFDFESINQYIKPKPLFLFKYTIRVHFKSPEPYALRRT